MLSTHFWEFIEQHDVTWTKKGKCGHAMASFDGHSFCTCCRDKGKGKDPCIEKSDTTDCKFCNVLIPEQRAQLATPSYKLKKEKHEAKELEVSSPQPR